MVEQHRQPQCDFPDVCNQKFYHLQSIVESTGKKLDELTNRLFGGGEDSIMTRMVILEEWKEIELKNRSIFKTAMITLCTLILIQIGLAFFNNLTLKYSVEILQRHEMLLYHNVQPQDGVKK